MKRFSVVCVVLLAMASASLFAQDREIKQGKFGLTFPNIGAIWHITDNIAFLPGFNFNHDWSSFSLLDGTESSSDSVGVDASVRFYMPDWKGVRFYLSPKYRFMWGDVNTESEIITASTNNYYHRISGVWGLQYALSDRVSLFGDIGFGYSRRSNSSINIEDAEYRSYSVGTEGSWGLVLYLN
jgi:hypothetical protein